MGDTLSIDVNKNWQELSLLVGESFTFNNQGPVEVFVRESAIEPGADERGYSYMPSQGGWGRIESSSVWVRSKVGQSRFHYGVFTP